MNPPAGRVPMSTGGKAPRKTPLRKTVTWAGVAKHGKLSQHERLRSVEALVGTRASDDSDERLLKTGEYSDATVQCNEFQIKVHKSIVCGRSDYFRGALDGHFMETAENAVSIPDDQIVIILRVLQFIYFGRYSLSSPSGTEEETVFERWISSSIYENVKDEFNNEDRDLHIKMFAAGDKYMLEDLQVYAYNNVLPLLFRPREIFHVDKSKLTQDAALEIVSASQLIFATSQNTGLRDVAVCLIKVAISKNGYAYEPLQKLVSETEDISAAVALSHLKWHFCTSCGEHAVYVAKLCACGAWDCTACKQQWARICYICFTPWDMESVQHEMENEEQEGEEGDEELDV